MIHGTDEREYLTWVEQQAAAGAPVAIAATVVILRDAPGGLEVLLLRRNTAVEFAGGFWVFPGGRLDPEDHERGEGSMLAAARHAAVREALEEAAQTVDPGTFVWFSHWTPPPQAPKRFATFFFACRALGDAVTIDGSEIHDSAWRSARDMLARHTAGEVDLAPPTWLTLHDLSSHDTVDDALTALAERPPRFYETRIHRVDGVLVAVWHGDAAYDSGDLDAPGPRHRLAMRKGGWVLDESGHTFDRPGH